jgi:PAS domain S-box-containing protein
LHGKNRGASATPIADRGTPDRTRTRPACGVLERAESLAQTGCWEWDLKTGVLLWSDNMFRMLGLSPGEIVPTPEDVLARTHPDDRQRVEDEIESARNAGKPPEVIYRSVWPDGSVHVLQAATAIDGIGEDSPSRLIGSVRDITELTEALRGTAESLTLMETLQSMAPVGFAFVDRDFRIVRINDSLAEVNGAPAEEQIGRTVAEVVPEVWAEMESAYRDVLESGKATVNLSIEREGGGPHGLRYWLASVYPVRIEEELIGIGVVVVDISERAEAAHFRSAVMDTIVEGLYVLDGEGRLTSMNAAASKLLGWTQDELRGKSMHETIHFQHADGSPHSEEDCELLKVRTEGRSVRMAHQAFTRKNGTICPVAYSAAPLMNGPRVRGVVVVFRDTTAEEAESDRAQRALDTLVWVGRVRDAIDQDRLKLFSQPIVPLTGGRPAQELLLRMVGPEGEIIRPRSFLPVAEKYGLIGEIDRWVIGKAARAASRGQRVEANLSADSIGNLDLLSVVERELREAGADPSNLVIEITETALMENIDAGEAFARGLSEIGCGVALDDFGTGFGSFTYLKKMPITFLKIDIDFVRDLVANRASQHLVGAIVGLARDFGYQTIAEGVEDAETLALLQDYGVDFVQGYHLGRPAEMGADGA